MKKTLLAVLLGCIGTSAWAAPAFVNGITISAETGDQFGTSINDGRLGFFSDLYYDPNRKEWWALSDRGPGGGTISYETRVQRFTLDVNTSTGAISNFKIAESIKFSDGGTAFNGLSPNPTNVLGHALDPEGFVVNPKTGHFLVSDEYGPSLREFDRSGNLIRTFTTPGNLVPRSAADVPNFAGDAGNVAGKRTNRGFEGLAISPDGKYSFAVLQSAMLDEGGGNGVYSRIVKFDNATGKAVAQYAYKMEGSNQGRGISALVAINDHEFLIIERNNRGLGVPDANLASPNKKVFRIDLTGATNLMGADLAGTADDVSISGGVLPVGVNPVTKQPSAYIDLAANTLGALDNLVPEKWEGLSIGPKLDDGTYLLLAGTDSDYSITQNGTNQQFEVFFNGTSRIQCDIGTFANCLTIATDGSLGGVYAGPTDGYRAIPGVLHAYKSGSGDLASYVAPVSEPATAALLLGGMGAIAATRRRRTK